MSSFITDDTSEDYEGFMSRGRRRVAAEDDDHDVQHDQAVGRQSTPRDDQR